MDGWTGIQCDISTGTVIDVSISRVTPPQTSDVIRGRLYAPITIRSAPKSDACDNSNSPASMSCAAMRRTVAST